MIRRLRLTLVLIASGLLVALPLQAFETLAKAAWVYDVTTHTVLMDKNAHVAVHPASMSKLMTINMLFEALRDGRVTMETTFAVSARAKAMGGSSMFVTEGDRPTVDDLLHGMIVNSGNDACVVVAEGLAGTEDAFAIQMTARARALGMMDSTFANASGWPDPNQLMSMKDLGRLAQRLIEEFPEFYPIFAVTEFTYQGRAPDNRFNRNPLLKLGIGADGLKTGHTEEAGYGMVGSVLQGDRRIIFAISGLASEAERAEESERIATWAFRQFALKTVAKAGQHLAEAEVFMGNAPTVGLVLANDLRLLIPALVQDGVTAEIVYNGPMTAPIAQGDKVAELVIQVADLPEMRVPLVAEKDIGKGGFFTRLSTAARHLRTSYLGGEPAS